MTEGDQPHNIRARPMLMLLAIYGLRAGEVNRLRLDDVDWEHEVFRVVSSKTGQVRTYPLTRTVGDAILRYLKEVRPQSSHRELFLSLNPPFRPVRMSLGIMVRRRLRSLNVSPPHFRASCSASCLRYAIVGRWPVHSRRSATSWGTGTPKARESMPRLTSLASAKWPLSTWEVSYEPPTPDRTVHILSTVAWIIVRHKYGNPPGFRPCLRPASLRWPCSRSACGCVPGKSEASDQDVVHQVELLAVLLPICRESRLHHRRPSSGRNAGVPAGIRSLHLYAGRNPLPSPG